MLRTDFKTTGVATILYNLDELRGRKLQSTTARALGAGAGKVFGPAIAAATPHKYGGHGGEYPTKGLLKRRQQITSRRVKTRPGELVAISIKPRQWFFKFVVGGTKSHLIHAANAALLRVASGRTVRAMNQRPGSVRALFFHGIFRTLVHHPGAKPDDYIRRAAQGKGPALMHELDIALKKKLKER